MRWLLALALAGTVACGESTLGPTSTVDGTWKGQGTGFQITMTLSQQDTVVTGTAVLVGVSGFANFTVDGKMVSQSVSLLVSTEGFEPMMYSGTLSTREAVINGRLNGSGFTQLELALKKQ